MKIAVLSGKGGAGKTFASVSLAVSAGNATYLDCDVEEPNGRLFLKPEGITETAVKTLLPTFDKEKCTRCRSCVDFCAFNAMALIGDVPQVFTDVCHSCGGCAIVCPTGAITEVPRQVGHVESGTHDGVTCVTGVLNLGEASGVPVIKSVLERASAPTDTTIIDCPPGSACTVMESVSDSDYCILVAEPTAFGLHNFQMVHELVSLLKKPCGVIINKSEGNYPPLDEYCRERNLPILLNVPYTEQLAAWGAVGDIAVEHDDALQKAFCKALNTIRKEVAQ